MVEVAIVQVVGVAAVTYRGMSTTWTMLMRMVGMGGGGATRHNSASFSGSGAPMPQHGFCAAMSINGQLVNRRPCGKGDHLAHVWPQLLCRLREPLSRERGLVLS